MRHRFEVGRAPPRCAGVLTSHQISLGIIPNLSLDTPQKSRIPSIISTGKWMDRRLAGDCYLACFWGRSASESKDLLRVAVIA